MGTDITVAVERRIDGTWQRVEDLVPNPVHQLVDRADAEQWSLTAAEAAAVARAQARDPWYDARNRVCFAVLAGVGRRAGDPLIAEPRGLPPDASDDTLLDHAELEGVAHHASWLTLAELCAFDWEQRIDRLGWLRPWPGAVAVTSEDVAVARAHLERVGHPPSGWTISRAPLRVPSGSGRTVASEHQTEVRYRPRVAELALDFLAVVGRMVCLAPDDLESLRIVFWFDS